MSTVTHFEVEEEYVGDKRSLQLYRDAEDENVPKRIRSVLELYMRDIIIEVLLTTANDGFASSMRGLFHCKECLKSWKDGNRGARPRCFEPTRLSYGDLVSLEKEETLHIIKLLIKESYTESVLAIDALNGMDDSEGIFQLNHPELCGETFAGDFSPLLLVSQDEKPVSGTFTFTPERGRALYHLFSPTFKVASSSKSSRSVAVFEEDKKLTCSRVKKKRSFSLANGQPIDMKSVLSSGLLSTYARRQFFFSGKMKRGEFVPESCISDTGIIYLWKYERNEKNRFKFRNVREVFTKTKCCFPEFPCGRGFFEECDWKLITDRRLIEIPERFLQTEEKKEENPSWGATIYLGGVVDDDGALVPKNKLRLPPSKFGKLRIWPKSDAFQKIIFEKVVCPSTPSTLSGSSDLDEVVLQPSGTPANDLKYDTNRGTSDANSLDNSENGRRSLDSLGRTPSLVSFREIDPAEERQLFQRRSKNLLPRNPTEVLNPTVKNRTGKPSTKPGSLADASTAAKGEGETTQFEHRPVTMSKRRDSTALSSTRFQGSDTGFGGSNPVNRDPVTKAPSSQTRVGSRTSSRALETSRRRSTMLGDGNKATTPATFARQREIEKKTKKEKEEVKAKYQYAAHHSMTSGAAQEQLTLGGTKTSNAALMDRDQGSTIGQTESKTPLMKPYTGERKLPRPRKKTRKGPAVQSKQEDECQSTEDIILASEEKEKDPLLEDIPNEFIEDFFLSDDEDYNFSDLSSLSDSDEADGKKEKNKSLFFPFLDGLTVLNFTENFRFSYFMMPGYVKEKNKSIKKGVLKLPVIKEPAKKQRTQDKRKLSKDRSSLMKRIEKLNEYEGNTDPRVRH